jgi:hypothetical protein
MEKTEEQKAIVAAREADRRDLEEVRLTAVRNAYWDHTDPASSDLYPLHDVLSHFLGIKEPTLAQQKTLFLMLPAEIIGLIVQWGVSDTEVREAVYNFGDTEKAAIAVMLGVALS